MLSLLGLDPKQFSKSRRASNSTSKDMISDFNSTTRYRRRKETEKVLQFIHGGGQVPVMVHGTILPQILPRN